MVRSGAEKRDLGRVLPDAVEWAAAATDRGSLRGHRGAYKTSIQEWSPNCAIVYDKFHIMQHANKAVDEVRRAEFFRRGARMRGVVKGKRWLLLTRWVHLTTDKRQQLNHLFAPNRKVMKAYLLKESLERLWTYTNESAMLRYLKSWTLQLRWQRLPAFEKRAHMLIDHLDGILNYCRVVEAINGNIKTLFGAAVGTRIYATFCSRRSAWPSPKPNSWFSGKPREMGLLSNSCSEPIFRLAIPGSSPVRFPKSPSVSHEPATLLFFWTPMSTGSV